MRLTEKDQDFLKLILDNRGIILRICQLYCSEKVDREDLTQEIIYQLWKSGHRFDKERRFTTWMYRVALNTAISFYREGKRWGDALPLSQFHLEIEESPTRSVQEKERLTWLESCVLELKEFDRALILLYFEEKSYADIAEIMGISETNVATKLSRIKEKLKHCILTRQN
jgi:RNA polymerase sigma factor (sigma-70 family)